MVTRAEMDHLASKLSTLETFSEVVRGLPAVVLTAFVRDCVTALIKV
jgi:hypothetical protein